MQQKIHTTSKLTESQRDNLGIVFSTLPNLRAFTVTGKGKGDIKNPKSPKHLWGGSWADESKYRQLLTLDEALDLLDSNADIYGVAICFFPDCGYGAIDYDKCMPDLSDGSPAQKLAFQTMAGASCEISRSGTGLHQFFIGNTINNKDNGHIEVFGDSGYICLTGDFGVEAHPVRLANKKQISLVNKIVTDFKEGKKKTVTPEKPPEQALQSHQVIAKMEPPEVVLDLLKQCNPECQYAEWMAVAFAFRASYSGSDGYEQFDAFSQGGSTYSPNEVRKLWDSYNPIHSGYSLGTLIYSAKKHHGLPASFTRQANVSTLNDTGNAERFAKRFKDAYLYITELKLWLYWRDGYWQTDMIDSVKTAAMEVAKSIFLEAAQADTSMAQKIANWANTSLQKPRIDAMIELAKPWLSTSIHNLDRDSMLLGVKNGVVDLKTGRFRKAEPSDLITQQCDVFYDDDAKAPVWESFVDEVSSHDVSLVAYKQCYWGYSLSGQTSEQCFFYYHGWGRNGKSTEIGVMQALLGSYAKSIPASVLMVRNNYGSQGPTPEIARLVGARLVTANETEDGARLAEAQIKAMTGQDVLTARVLHGDPFDFRPKFKLFISGNHKPVIRGEDDGIWRRIKVIPFKNQILESQVDKHLYEKLMQERSGILNWAIKGCLIWQENGLTETQVVKDEVASYRSDQDLMGAWLDERCQLGANQSQGTRETYMDYANWVRSAGANAVSETRFVTRMIERGFKKDRVKQKMTFFGIACSLHRPY